MKITISGKQGAGKTTAGKELAKRLGYRFASIGDLRGRIAKERGITIDKLNEIGKRERWVHEEADKKTIEIGKKEDNFVIEGWIAFHFIPNSKKIFLDVDEEIGAKRIFLNQRPDEQKCHTEEELKNLLKKRLKETDYQFKKYYGVDFLDKSNYDFVLNTTSLNLEEVVNKILKFLK